MKENYIVILFYKFIEIKDPEKLKNEHVFLCKRLNLKGRAIIGKEGINATFEGLESNIEKYKEILKNDPRFFDLTIKESLGNGSAFPKLSIRVRDEIVTLKAGEFNIEKETAAKLSADGLEEWYRKGEDFVVLDLRNKYEIDSGKFRGTVDPGLENFRDLPQKLKTISGLKDKKVVAVCTGGIRCEKATCLLKKEGFSNMYQLEDGIHTYMQKYPNSNFLGTLFVFDNRITTPVIEKEGREIIGKCLYCGKQTENYASDDSVKPSKKFLCCDSCFERHKGNLREIVAKG